MKSEIFDLLLKQWMNCKIQEVEFGKYGRSTSEKDEAIELFKKQKVDFQDKFSQEMKKNEETVQRIKGNPGECIGCGRQLFTYCSVCDGSVRKN